MSRDEQKIKQERRNQPKDKRDITERESNNCRDDRVNRQDNRR